MTWDKRPLAECATFMSGGTPNKGNPEFWGGDIPWVSSGEMADQFVSNTSLHLTNAGLLAGSKLVPEGTLFAVVRGMSLATEFRVCYAMRPMAFNQDVKAIVAVPDIEPYFLFSSLRAHSKQIRDLATEAAHGTKKLEMERLLSFCIPVPDRATQLSVIAAAKRYDDLIENNRRRIALLEESARLLYREWFVHLRFPGHESSGLQDGLPVGWSRQTVADVTCFLNRGITPAYNDDAMGMVINQKCIRNGLLNLKPARRQSKEVKPERFLQVGDVLINSTGAGTLGRVAVVRAEVPNCTVDTHVTIARPATQELRTFMAMALLELEPTFSGMGVGATNQLELARAEIGSVPLAVPPVPLQVAFQDLVWPLLIQSETLSKSNERLAEARDALLPRLMSGEIAV